MLSWLFSNDNRNNADYSQRFTNQSLCESNFKIEQRIRRDAHLLDFANDCFEFASYMQKSGQSDYISVSGALRYSVDNTGAIKLEKVSQCSCTNSICVK